MNKTTIKTFAISIVMLFAINTLNAQWTQLGQNINGEGDSDFSGKSIDITPNGQYLVIGADNNAGAGANAGHVRVYENISGNWVQLGSDIDAQASGDKFGTSVAISSNGMTIVAGAIYNDDGEDNAGSVRVYQYNGTNWVQLGADIDGSISNENRGARVDISADGTIITTADQGRKIGIISYQYDGTNWVTLGDTIPVTNSYYKLALSADGNSIIVGNDYGTTDNGYGSGFAAVYSYSVNNWSLVGDTIDGDVAFDHIGYAVDISDDGQKVVIGAPNNDGSYDNGGQVKVLEYNGTDWVQIGNDLYGANETDLFGSSVSINNNGSVIAVGAPSNDDSFDNAGQVQLYKYETGSWQQVGNNINGEANGDNFGYAISLSFSGDTIAIGAPYNDETANAAGNVRVFKSCNTYNTLNEIACGSYTSPSGNNTWTTSGVYTDVISNASGCDSIITINLTINQQDNTTDVETACDIYTWIDGITYTESNNTAIYTLTNVNGCDSVVTLNLTINHSNTAIDTQTACDTYTWIDGITYTENNNTATYTLTNSNGCDSVVTLNLTIETVSVNVTQNNDTLIAELQTGATYQWLDCNNNYTEILGADTTIFIPSTTGDYAVEVLLNSCVDTSSCYNVVITDLVYFENSVIELYPNPTKQYVNIILPNFSDVKSISVYNLLGKKVLDKSEINKNNLIDISKLISGTYFISIETNENIITKKLIIK